MNKKTFLILAVAYSAVTFILNDVFQTTIGKILMTVSFLALIFLILWFIYSLFNFSHKTILLSSKPLKKDQIQMICPFYHYFSGSTMANMISLRMPALHQRLLSLFLFQLVILISPFRLPISVGRLVSLGV